MNVKEIMTRRIEYVTQADNALTAARRMRDFNVGALPVKDDQNALSGMLTDRDIVTRGVAEGKPAESTTVKQLMTPGAAFCNAEQTVEEAAALMEREQVRRLIVVDEDENAVGIVALGDIAVKTPGDRIAGEAVGEISKPETAASRPAQQAAG